MNTPAHLVIGLAAFGRPDSRAISTAALIGALLPDLSLYLMAGVSLFILGIPPRIVFDELYFSETWQLVFAVDNSFLVWGVLLLVALAWRHAPAIALTGAAMLHLACDFPLHNDDARAHFWPLTDWVFVSPVSYWDPRHHGGWVGAVELVLVLALCALLWRRFRTFWPRIGIALLATAQAAPAIMWGLVFG